MTAGEGPRRLSAMFARTFAVASDAPVDGAFDWTVDCTGLIRVYRLGYDGFVTYTGEKGQIRFLAGKNWSRKV